MKNKGILFLLSLSIFLILTTLSLKLSFRSKSSVSTLSSTTATSPSVILTSSPIISTSSLENLKPLTQPLPIEIEKEYTFSLDSECKPIESENKTLCVKEFINKDGSIFRFELLSIATPTPNFPISKIKVISKPENKIIDEIEVKLSKPLSLEDVKFFDLDKNGFVDFMLPYVSIAAYNAFSNFYLYNPKEKKYREGWGQDYNLKDSLVSFYMREGMTFYTIDTYKAVNGEFIKILEEAGGIHGGGYRRKELRNGKFVTTHDYNIKAQDGKCVYTELRLINDELKPVEIIEYYSNEEGKMVQHYKKIDENGKIAEEKYYISNKIEGSTFKNDGECEEFIEWIAGRGGFD